MFIERQVMEKHLLGGKGTLIFLSNMLSALARSRQFNTSWQAATPEPNVSRGAFKTFQFF